MDEGKLIEFLTGAGLSSEELDQLKQYFDEKQDRFKRYLSLEKNPDNYYCQGCGKDLGTKEVAKEFCNDCSSLLDLDQTLICKAFLKLAQQKGIGIWTINQISALPVGQQIERFSNLVKENMEDLIFP